VLPLVLVVVVTEQTGTHGYYVVADLVWIFKHSIKGSHRSVHTTRRNFGLPLIVLFQEFRGTTK